MLRAKARGHEAPVPLWRGVFRKPPAIASSRGQAKAPDNLNLKFRFVTEHYSRCVGTNDYLPLRTK